MSKILNKIKKTMYIDTSTIPRCILNQSQKFFLIGGLLSLVGIFAAIVIRDIFVIIAGILLGIGLSLVGYLRIRSVAKNGYFMVKGLCEKIEYTIPSQITGSIGPNIPSRFIIRNELFDNDLYSIPYFKQNILVSVGDLVAIYYKKDVRFLLIRGFKSCDHFLGYEILPPEK